MDDRRLNMIVARFNYAEKWRSPLEAQCLEWYKLYIGYRKPVEGRSNLHIPYTLDTIDTYRARLFKALLGVRPYISFIPQQPDDELKANVAEQLLDWQLEQGNFKKEFYDFITSLLIYPCAWGGIGWNYETAEKIRKMPIIQDGFLLGYAEQKVEEVIFDDNEFKNLDWFDMYPDPEGTDLDSCRFVFHREYMTKAEIEDRLDWLSELGNVNKIKDWEDIKASGEELKISRQDRLGAIGLSDPTDTDSANDFDDNKFEVLNYWQDDAYAMLINRRHLAYDGDNYFQHGKKPFIVACFDPKPNEFYGFSLVQIIEHLQHELNTQRNQRIDNVSMVINRMWKARKASSLDPDDLISRPHGIVWVDNMDDVEPFLMPDVTSSSYEEENRTVQDIERVSGTPAVVRGSDPSRKETATETSIKADSASIRFEVKIQLFENVGLKRMAKLMDENNKQFIDKPKVIRIVGEEGGYQWPQINPEDIQGNFDYSPAASNVDPMVSKIAKRGQFIELMNVVANNPYVNQYKLTQKLLETYDIKNPQELMYTQEELAMQQQQMQEQAKQQAVASLPPEQQQLFNSLPPEQQEQMLNEAVGGGMTG